MLRASGSLLKSLRGDSRLLAASMASLAAGQRYDIVIYGATGFTGQYVVEEVARVAQGEESRKVPLTWAVAGRTQTKLHQSIATAQKETGLDLENVGVILADVQDQDSLNKMAAQSTVIINCVGPYQLYGEPVVRACIDNGASHVDISGEPQFLESMQLKYNKAADEAGVHIVGACGYDSIPAEMGLSHMIKNFKGELNSVQMYVKMKSGGAKTSIHTGTMESAALVFANNEDIPKIRRQLFPTSLPKPKHKIVKKGILHKNETLNMWGIPFPSDEPVVYRTQRYRSDVLGLRPVQFQQFFGLPSFFHGIGLLIGMAYFAVICYFSWTRKLLIKYPGVMTAGVFTSAGPDREELKKLSFTVTLIGQGWAEQLASGSDQHNEPPDSSITVKVSGPDPGYGATALMMVASAMTILREKQSCTGRGGVMTPGVAFMNTALIDRIVNRGMTVTVEK